jgi:hypothetical protein
LHFAGTALLLVLLGYVVATRRWTLLLLLPVVGYGFTWVGHFLFQSNCSATFSHPWYSLRGDFTMFLDPAGPPPPLYEQRAGASRDDGAAAAAMPWTLGQSLILESGAGTIAQSVGLC